MTRGTEPYPVFQPPCARRYLFKPQPGMAQQLQPDTARALTTPGSLKIGIHLRLGDAEMEGAAGSGHLHCWWTCGIYDLDHSSTGFLSMQRESW